MWVTVVLLWLFVINLGTAFGTGIYDARIIGPQWASSPPEFVLRWNADRLTRLGPAFAWVASRARGWLDYWHVDIGQPGFSPFDWVAAAYVVEPGLFGCAVTDAWIEDEWVFWLYPRPSLLVGPATPVNVTVKAEVIYCPQANPSLHGYLLSGEMPFVPGFWDRRGWGCGLSYITRHDDVAAVPGWWDGGWARPGNRTSSRK